MLYRALRAAIKARLVPIVKGPPGTGKSSIARYALAHEGYVHIKDVRAATIEAVDVSGLPYIKDGRTHYATPDMFPTLPKSAILFDDLGQATPAVMSALSEPLLDRTVRGAANFTLPPDTVMICTANRETDRAGVNRMPTFINNRLLHFDHMPTVEGSMAYFNGLPPVDPATIPDLIPLESWNSFLKSYLRARPGQFHNFDPKTSPPAFASSRSWEMVNKLLPWIVSDEDLGLILACSAVGDEAGGDFCVYLTHAKLLPPPHDVLANPDGITLPDEPSMQHALLGSVVEYAPPAQAEAACKFLKRLPPDMAGAGIIDLRDKGIRLKGPTGNKLYFSNPTGIRLLSESHQFMF